VKVGTRVHVEFQDITTNMSGWVSIDKLEQACIELSEITYCGAVGYVIEDSQEALVLASLYDPNTEAYGNFTFIPRGAIAKVRKLNE
jgi:hypothetical protein